LNRKNNFPAAVSCRLEIEKTFRVSVLLVRRRWIEQHNLLLLLAVARGMMFGLYLAGIWLVLG
jgi:hypothetical protein